MELRVRDRLDRLREDWRAACRRYPRLVPAVVIAFALVASVSLGGGAWFLNSLRHGLPDDAAMRKIGDMDQATAVFDASDRLAFTIYKEQRIEIGRASCREREWM